MGNSTMGTEELLREAKAYFQERPGFKRLFKGLVEKYYSLGRLGGSIMLEEVSPEERATLETFFRRRLPGGSLQVSVSQFSQALAATRFGGLELLDLLTIWHGSDLKTKRELQEGSEQRRQAVFCQLMKEYQEPRCQLWLKAALNKDLDTQQIQRAYIGDQNFMVNMAIALNALGNLPDSYQRLSVFARNICGDPHGLDIDCGAGKLFLGGLQFVMTHQGDDSGGSCGAALSAIELTNELLYCFRLLRDDLLNFVTCFGFAAYADQQEIVYWRLASEVGAPINVPLREIHSLIRKNKTPQT